MHTSRSLVRGHYHLIPDDPAILEPGNLSALTAPVVKPQNPDSAGELAHSAAAAVFPETPTSEAAISGLETEKALNE